VAEEPKPLKTEQMKWLQDLISANPEAVGLASSVAAIAAGAGLMLDDYRDFGEPMCEGCEAMDSPHPHHWLLGALAFLGGVAGVCASGLAILKRLAELNGEKKEGASSR
jgi:hypothetical protein